MRFLYDWILRLAGKNPAEFDRVSPTLNRIPDGWVVFLASLSVLLFVLWIYYGVARNTLERGPRIVLGLLRTLIFALALLLLTEPVLTAIRTETKRSTVVVLADDSFSMELKFPHVEEMLGRKLLSALGKDYVLTYVDDEEKNVVVPPEKLTLEHLRHVSRLDAVKAAVLRKDPDGDFWDALAKKHEIRFLPLSFLDAGMDVAQNADSEAPSAITGAEPTPKTPKSGPEHLTPRARETRLGDALLQAARDLRGQSLAGIVVLSDGGQNAGEDPIAAAKRFKTRRIPIFTVGVGDPGEPRDLSLTVEGPEAVMPDDPFDLNVVVTRSGCKNVTDLEIQVKEGDKVVAVRQLHFAPDREKASVSVPLRAAAAGRYTYVISVPVQEGELRSDNNVAAHVVAVVEKKLKILFVEGLDRPRWDFRYLKNALRRDHTVEADVLLVVGDGAFLWDGSEGKEPIEGFPTREKDLMAYDALLLGDVSPDLFTREQMDLIKRFVREGGGLILVAGERNMPAAFLKSPLSDLLSVEPSGTAPSEEETASLEPFSLELTPEGQRAAWTRLDQDESVSREIWAGLPKLQWYYPVKNAKKIASVVAVHPFHKDAEGKKMPIITVMPYGGGQVLFIGTDELWRWRYGVGDRYHYRFYNQAVRRLSMAKRLGADKRFSLGTERKVYAVGDRVALDATVKDEEGRPTNDARITLRGASPKGDEFTVELKSVPGRAGTYEGEYYPLHKGEYVVWLTDLRRAAERQAETNFKVELPQLEYENPRMNEALLKNMASAGGPGGKYFDLNRLAEIPPLLSPREETVQRPETVNLWDNWFPLVFFVTLITAEWLLRKRLRLA